MKTSNFMSLNWLDLGKGFLVAFIVFLLNYLQTNFVPSLDISTELKMFIVTAIGYLLKNFFTPAKKEDAKGLIGTHPKDR